ncbi:type IV pilin N-terminal domain-containing protein [Halobacteria archaeon AArc-m2/3/4]|uniref:Type IV pilin N-terminal domain-containing protein n=1 Tax=Natronoglomus mannanivorans TaxID=2979990 RepID=A0AAP3E1C8_9EURY|nr:type IV pilin N-terminal domain-containing protein [Halobacteria archaeon AArc-xg1-1]MCU4973733.1 type IV pilin N-terminal domain-containing protein [Halobacteria archaeon AArc-m2/3/4]
MSRVLERVRGRPRPRAVSPVVGTLLLIALTICLAAVVAVGIGFGPGAAALSTPPTATFELTVDADEQEISLQHVAGETIDVRELRVHVTVEDEPLAEQPPVPFFSENGFRGGPDGPFNERADPQWSVGETASVTVAGTNSPSIDTGDEVSVTLAVDGQTVATLETEAT